MMRMTLFVVKFAPIGVFGFTLYAAAGKGPAAFRVLGLYVVTVSPRAFVPCGGHAADNPETDCRALTARLRPQAHDGVGDRV